MNFSQYIKKLKLKTIDEVYIPIDTIKCQCNSDRYKYWVEACGSSLDIKNGPYWEYLMYKKLDKYKALFRLYGRSELWVTNNILKFQKLYEDISLHGFNEKKGLPIVLNKPVIPSDHNCGYEVWEGHRRLSICLYLGRKQKVRLCEIV